MTRPRWFESEAFRAFDFAAGGRLNTHRASGCAVPQGSRVWFAGRLRAVARFYDSGAPCYAGAWCGAVRVNGHYIRGTVYVSPEIGTEISALRFSPESEWIVSRPRHGAPFTIAGPLEPDPGDPASFSGFCPVRFVDPETVRADDGRRGWVRLYLATDDAIAEGIDPAAD